MGFAALWGNGGMVSKTIAANPALKANANTIVPGAWIVIPATQIPNSANYHVVAGEVRKGPGAETEKEKVWENVNSENKKYGQNWI